MKELQTVLNNILTDKNVNLKPENLKKGVTCLGVTGTLEASAGSGGVKQFSTVEEMNASTGNTEGDLAIVYGNTLANMVANTETQYITFPDTVTLPTAFAGDYNSNNALRAVDSYVSFAPQVTLSQTSFVFDRFDDWDEYTINVEYTSTDGITYTRNTTITNPVDVGTVVKPGTQWNDNLGYFMKVDSTSFTGLYKYSGTAWELAPTDLTTVADDVYESSFYGKNGVETGTLQNKENLNKNEVKYRVNIWSNYNSGIVCPADASSMFRNGTNLTTIPLLDTSNVTDMTSMFDYCTNLTTIPLLDTSHVTNMEAMFSHCSSLTEIPLLDTSNVTKMVNMFLVCTNLTAIPLLDTSNVTSMHYIFTGCSSLTTIPSLNTSNVTSMLSMFNGCSSLTTIPSLDTSKVTNMHRMFSNCTNLTTIPLLDTSKVTKMETMFDGCSSLSDESLNNILTMCTNATSYTSTKTLKFIGLTSAQATKCATLSNYSAFTAAGWTTGY